MSPSMYTLIAIGLLVLWAGGTYKMMYFLGNIIQFKLSAQAYDKACCLAESRINDIHRTLTRLGHAANDESYRLTSNKQEELRGCVDTYSKRLENLRKKAAKYLDQQPTSHMKMKYWAHESICQTDVVNKLRKSVDELKAEIDNEPCFLDARLHGLGTNRLKEWKPKSHLRG